MKKAAVFAACLAALGYGVLYLGLVDISADTPHSTPVLRFIEWARERAIARASADTAVPADLGNADRARRGAGNYEAMCATCHLTPGLENSELRSGLYPQPPNLSRPSGAAPADGSAGRRFWIIKHGIKASGMPAWAKGGMEDEAIWDLVAFLNTLPSLTAEQYRRMVEQSPGHRHGGLEAQDHHDDHASHQHSHQ